MSDPFRSEPVEYTGMNVVSGIPQGGGVVLDGIWVSWERMQAEPSGCTACAGGYEARWSPWPGQAAQQLVLDGIPVFSPSFQPRSAALAKGVGPGGGGTPGLLEGEGLLCPVAIEEAEYTTYYVNAVLGLGPSAGVLSLSEVRTLLGDASNDLTGVRILFRRGDIWHVATEGRDANGSFLTIRASSSDPARPLILGAYQEESAGEVSAEEGGVVVEPFPEEEVPTPTLDFNFSGQSTLRELDPLAPPHYELLGTVSGSGEEEEEEEEEVDARPVFLGMLENRGLVLQGCQNVQIQDLEVRDFDVGISVLSYAADNLPMVGPTNIVLASLVVEHCLNQGVFISSTLNGTAHSVELISAPPLVYAEPYDEDGLPILVQIDGWWPSQICIEDCDIGHNGQGRSSGEANVLITSHSAYCLLRHNRIHNGTDGVTFEGAGPGHVLEYNAIESNRTLLDSNDDGDGVDIKDTWNRTYLDSASGTLLDIVSVAVYNNTITDNAWTGVLLHQNARHVHVFNNLIVNNAATDYSGVHIKSGQALYDPMNGVVYDAGGVVGWGPGTTERIYVYRNLIVENLANGLTIRQETTDPYHGNFDDIQIVNNTIASNGQGGSGYGLMVNVSDLTASATTNLDADEYTFHNLVLANNIYADNIRSDNVQVRIADYLAGLTYDGQPRGFVDWILDGLGDSIQNNCYYNSVPGSAVIRYENLDAGFGDDFDLSDIQIYTGIETSSVEEVGTLFEPGRSLAFVFHWGPTTRERQPLVPIRTSVRMR